MAIRQTTHVLKNSDIVNRPLPSSLFAGEPIVNTADGIMYFSGVTTSTDEWTPAGTGTTANFFEVGSNLYDLRLRNKLTEYQGVNGGGLTGKFLSGTTSGFVLADISDIAATTDSYTTGATWNPNVLTLGLNQGKPSVTVDISTFSGLTVSGTLTATTINGGTILSGGTNLNTLFQPFGQDNYTTGSTLIGSTIYYNTVNALSAYTTDLSSLDINDTYTTGSTLIGTTAYFNTTDALSAYSLNLSTLVLPTDVYVTGFTYNNANAFTITQSNGGPTLVANINTVTGLTNTGNLDLQGQLSNSTGDVVINDNLNITGTTTSFGNILPGTSSTYDLGSAGNKWANIYVDSITTSGVTISGLGNNRVVYTDGSGLLATEASFTYNSGTDTMVVGNINVTNGTGTTAAIGQGGLTIGSGGSISTPGVGSLVVHGDLTVFGDTTTISTSELYVEDPQITLNYSTGTTSSTSIASGVRIQDGDGLGNDVLLTIAQMNTFTGGDVTEYTAATGYTNRAFLTQLNDIVIRNTNSNNGAPDGVRVLAEGDLLDGGSY